MNCQKCGTPLTGDVQFCPNCGAKAEASAPVAENPSPSQTPPPQPSADAPAAAPNQKKKNIIALICVSVVLVLILIILSVALHANDDKKVVKNYYKAIEKCSASRLLDTVPEDYVEELEDDYDLSHKEIKSAVQDYLDKYYSDYDDIRVSFQDKEKMSTADFADKMAYDMDEDADDKVKKATEFELKVRYQSDGGDTVETKSENFIVFKYDGDWYSMDAMFLVTMAVYTG